MIVSTLLIIIGPNFESVLIRKAESIPDLIEAIIEAILKPVLEAEMFVLDSILDDCYSF